MVQFKNKNERNNMAFYATRLSNERNNKNMKRERDDKIRILKITHVPIKYVTLYGECVVYILEEEKTNIANRKMTDSCDVWIKIEKF